MMMVMMMMVMMTMLMLIMIDDVDDDGLYCIVYRYLYSASHGVSQREAFSVHFSSRKKVRL